MDRNTLDRYGLVLTSLSLLFLLRVAGQLVAGLWAPPWLPPFDAWHSGLLPYPVLLTAQLALLGAMARVLVDFARGDGPLVRPRPTAARRVRCLAWLYAAAILARLTLATVAARPDGGWGGWPAGTLPVAFHLVLAATLLVWARFQRRAAGASGPRCVGVTALTSPDRAFV